MKRDINDYMAWGYAAIFYMSLALAIVGSAIYFIGYVVAPLLWIYLGCFMTFVSCLTIDFVYRFHVMKIEKIKLTVPKIVSEEEILAYI